LKGPFRAILMTVGLVLGLVASAAAQGWTEPNPSADPWEKASMKLGPVFLAPKFELQNLGVDNNVFRDETNPKQDLTGTIDVATIFGAHM
jgi:hypothetical protein